jgi:hypothetical protein
MMEGIPNLGQVSHAPAHGDFSEECEQALHREGLHAEVQAFELDGHLPDIFEHMWLMLI